MAILHLKNISLAFGVAPILSGVDLTLDKGERVCLIGRNGEGKSSLLKLISGTLGADDGEILSDHITISMLAQDVPEDNRSVLAVVMDGKPAIAKALQDYESLSTRCMNGDETTCQQMGECQALLDSQNGWSLEQKAKALIDKVGLNPDESVAQLSGGKKRRALLAQALVCEPDLLLLDEPTNHLDIDSIAWLENFLLSQSLTVLFITHDRQFVDKLATRIIELDRGVLRSYDVSQGVGGYGRYQELKAQELAAEQKSNDEFDKKLAQEEVWIRQGIKARRTRNEGRVRALKQLREERKARRETVGQVVINQNQAELGGKLVCQAKHLNLSYGDSVLVKDFNTVLMRGDKVGIIGSNGVGKTTLIHALLGLPTDACVQGTVKLGTKLVVSFFDQLKDELDLDKSVAENVSAGSDFVEVGGKDRHILSYLQDFLFAPARARTPVKALSGGEKARVLLAKNLLKPANVLVLDEPTNDLDMDTLELLEEFLVQFDGTVLLISHDRTFMDNVATQTWVFGKDDDGCGIIEQYIGGYSDYIAQKPVSPSRAKTTKPTKERGTPPKPKQKLSYKQSQQLASLPHEIEMLEQEQKTLSEKLADGSWFVSDLDAATKASHRLTQIDELLLQKLELWDSLERLS